jgi:hypothetical protein
MTIADGGKTGTVGSASTTRAIIIIIIITTVIIRVMLIS